MVYEKSTRGADATNFKLPQPLPLPAFFLLTNVGLAYVVAIRPPLVLRMGASLLLIYANIHGAVGYSVGRPEGDYTLGSVIWGSTIFNVVLFTWLISDPLKEIRYLKDPAPIAEKSLLVRVGYSVCMFYNWRLVGTTAQVANVPAPFAGTRTQYLWRRLRDLCVGLLVLDITETFLHSHHHLYAPDEQLPGGLAGYLGRSACMAAWIVICYNALQLVNCVLSFTAVATFLSEPAEWPDIFGPVSDAYTVRRAWGRVWHQLFRRHFARWGKVAARTLGARPGSFLSSQAQVHGAFAASAALHGIADLARGHGRLLPSSAPFFLLNGAAITLEDAATALARRAGVRGTGATRVLGYVWVAVWFTWATPVLQDGMSEAGMGSVPILGWSPTREMVLPFLRKVTAFVPRGQTRVSRAETGRLPQRD